tara:strand:- start:2435 stop:2536 length:102 start_codon:yes stop_codon:yes gene_type:complete
MGFTIVYIITMPTDDDDGPPDKGMMRPVFEGGD